MISGFIIAQYQKYLSEGSEDPSPYFVWPMRQSHKKAFKDMYPNDDLEALLSGGTPGCGPYWFKQSQRENFLL